MLLLGLHIHLHLFHHVKGPAFDYVGLGLAAFASWAGLPGPGESLLLAAGVFAAKHKLDITPVLVVALVGATAGGIVGWLFGLIAGRSVLTAPGPLRSIRLDAAEKGEQAFKRLEAVAILLVPSWVAGIFRARAGIYNLVNARQRRGLGRGDRRRRLLHRATGGRVHRRLRHGRAGRGDRGRDRRRRHGRRPAPAWGGPADHEREATR